MLKVFSCCNAVVYVFLPWHIDPVIALFPERPFELIVGFDECDPLKN